MDDSAFLVERRQGLPALPSNSQLEKYLDLAQLVIISQLEKFGWVLEIVRRNNRPNPLALLKSYSTHQWIAIEADGEVIENPNISIR